MSLEFDIYLCVKFKKKIFFLKQQATVETAATEMVNGDGNNAATTVCENNVEMRKKILTETMSFVCRGEPTFEQAMSQSIALNALVPTHHPNLSKCTRGAKEAG